MIESSDQSHSTMIFIPSLTTLVPTCNDLLVQTLLHYNHNGPSTSHSSIIKAMVLGAILRTVSARAPENERQQHSSNMQEYLQSCFSKMEKGFRLYGSDYILWQTLILFHSMSFFMYPHLLVLYANDHDE